MNQKGHLKKHQYSSMAALKGGLWPELEVSWINRINFLCNDEKETHEISSSIPSA